MKITDEAKVVLQDLLTANDSDCLKATVQQSCCGTSLVFNLAKTTEDDDPISINDILVLMTDEVQKRAESVTLTVQNEELALIDEEASTCC